MSILKDQYPDYVIVSTKDEIVGGISWNYHSIFLCVELSNNDSILDIHFIGIKAWLNHYNWKIV